MNGTGSAHEALNPSTSFEVEEPSEAPSVSADCFHIAMPAMPGLGVPKSKGLVDGMQPSALPGSPRAGKSKRPEHITIAVLAALVASLLVAVVLLSIESSSSSSRAASHRAEADQQRGVAASLMLTSGHLHSGGPGSEPANTRALARAAAIAESVGQPGLVVALLSAAINDLARAGFWPFDVRGSSSASNVPAATFSPDGSLLAIATADTITLTPVQPPSSSPSAPLLPPVGELGSVQCGGGRSVYSLAWSPSGEFLAAGCGTQVVAKEGKEDGKGSTATVWRVSASSSEKVPAFELLLEMDHGHRVRAMAWSPDSAALAAGDDDGKAKVWLVKQALASPGKEAAFVDVDHPGSNDVRAVAWHPSGRLLATGRTDSKLYVWNLGPDLRTPLLLAVGAEHEDGINAVAFSPAAGGLVASGGDDDQVLLWDLSPFQDLDSPGFIASELPLELVSNHSLGTFGGSVTGVAWGSPVKLAASANDGNVRLYEVKAEGVKLEQELWQPNAHFTGVSFTSIFPPRIAVGTLGPRAMVWQQAAGLGQGGPEFFHLQCSSRVRESFGKPDFSPRGWAWSADGLRFAMSSYQGHVCIFNRPGHLGPGQQGAWVTEAVLQIDGAEEHNVPARHLAFSDSGTTLAAGTDRDGVHVWARGVEPVHGGGAPWRGPVVQYFHNGDINDLVWSVDGKLLASASDDKSVVVLSMEHPDAKPTHLNGHTDAVQSGVLPPHLTCRGTALDGACAYL
mmetsp:Transcript_1814/g.5284  ORF Transcript_1814/g.5284 Transcript_1814/m.5284 type:complete len:737 (-) Transcript_1814:75-2285(-)